MQQLQWFPEQKADYCKYKGYNMVAIEINYQYIVKHSTKLIIEPALTQNS